MSAEALAERADEVTAVVTARMLDGARLQIVKAPPGAGKTHLLLELLVAGHRAGLRCAVGTFTNAQADDVCRRMAREHPGTPVVRFLSTSAADPDLPSQVTLARSRGDLPHGPCVVVGSTAKWGLTSCEPFDVLLVDEAWQISWADFLLLRSVAGRFVLIGDPGQIPPVVAIATDRWETSPNAPHVATPRLLLEHAPHAAQSEELPGSRRLPEDSVTLVNEFYDFDFGAFAAAGDRYVRMGTSGGRSGLDRVLDLLGETSIVGATVPTPDAGPPVEIDDDLAQQVAAIVSRLLQRESLASDTVETRARPLPLTPRDIGVVATHRIMNTRMRYRLARGLQNDVRVDTPERWQGLERKVMIVVHPLSGVTSPTAFDLETGRLCVMASRHRCALVVVTRDHIGSTLGDQIVNAEQALGSADVAGLGHHRHSRFWNSLQQSDRVVAL